MKPVLHQNYGSNKVDQRTPVPKSKTSDILLRNTDQVHRLWTVVHRRSALIKTTVSSAYFPLPSTEQMIPLSLTNLDPTNPLSPSVQRVVVVTLCCHSCPQWKEPVTWTQEDNFSKHYCNLRPMPTLKLWSPDIRYSKSPPSLGTDVVCWVPRVQNPNSRYLVFPLSAPT
jgi:hypothetical protein